MFQGSFNVLLHLSMYLTCGCYKFCLRDSCHWSGAHFLYARLRALASCLWNGMISNMRKGFLDHCFMTRSTRQFMDFSYLFSWDVLVRILHCYMYFPVFLQLFDWEFKYLLCLRWISLCCNFKTWLCISWCHQI